MKFGRSTKNEPETEVAENYYNVLKEIFTEAAKNKCDDEEFDGELRDHDFERKAEFVLKSRISPFSQALIEYLVLLEWKLQNKLPLISQMAIYNAILRLEKALTKADFWEVVEESDEEDEEEEDGNVISVGPLSFLSTFELNMTEQISSLYIINIIEEFQGTLFFPLKSPHEADAVITWRILEKIGSVKFIHHKTIYRQKLRICLENRLKTEIEKWVQPKLKALRLNNHMDILNDIKMFTINLKEMNEEITTSIKNSYSVNLVFTAANSSYFNVIAETMETKLLEVCNKVMEFLNVYNELHKEFHVNLRESSMLCHAFYLQIKKTIEILTSQTKTFDSNKLNDLEKIFEAGFLHLLHVIKVESHSRIQRAMASNDKESLIEEQGIWSSTVIVLSCFCVVLDEWKQLQIGNEDMKLTFLIKLTEILCDGCQICCESLLADVQSSSNSTDLKALKTICIHVNTIQYLLDYMLKLPETMNWNKRLNDLKSSAIDSETKREVHRLLTLILQTSTSHLNDIKDDIFEIIALYVRRHCNKFLNSWLKDHIIRDPRLQNVERFLAVLDDVVEILLENIKSGVISSILHTIWKNILTYVNSEFQYGRVPDYSKLLKKNIEEIYKYFAELKMEEVDDSTHLYVQTLNILDMNSRTTLELQLDYFGQVADEYVGSLEDGLGKIAFQVGFKSSGTKTIDIRIKIHKAQKIPVRNNDITSLKAKMDFCPNFLFPSIKPMETKPVTEELHNPVFDEMFSFANIPVSVLSIEGAVVRILLFNQDKSYCSEAVLRLSAIQDMKGLISLDFLPVHLLPLRKPGRNSPVFQTLKSRKKCDRRAKRFITKQIVPKNRRTIFSARLPGSSTFRNLITPITRISSYF